MKAAYSRERIDAVAINVSLAGAQRIIPMRHISTPLGTGPGDSRFCESASGYTVLYAAADLAMAFVETIVRDRFVRKRGRQVLLREVTERAWVELGTQSRRKLKLLDLRGDGCIRLGAPTDAGQARHHSAGRALGQAVYAEYRDIDGFLFASRLTGASVYALFDRAVSKLTVTGSGELKDHTALPAALKRYDITLVVY